MAKKYVPIWCYLAALHIAVATLMNAIFSLLGWQELHWRTIIVNTIILPTGYILLDMYAKKKLNARSESPSTERTESIAEKDHVRKYLREP